MSRREPLRTIFMGTPDFSVPTFEALLDRSDLFEIVGVYTQPDRKEGRGMKLRKSPIKLKAEAHELPVFQPERFSKAEEIDHLVSLRPDLIVAVAYGHILKKRVLDCPEMGCINVHASLLPRWRGAAPIQWSIVSGDEKTGVTTMEMVEACDAGGMFLQEETVIGPDDTASTIHDRLSEMGGRLIVPTVEQILEGSLVAKPQDNTQVTHAQKLTKELQWLSGDLSAQELDRRVRGFSPWPGSSIRLKDGARLRVLEARPIEETLAPAGGLAEKSGMLLFGCSSGSLQLLKVQFDGKKPISSHEFLNGFRNLV